MHRPGANPEDMQPPDFLCDFCGRAWDGTFPMVEGHKGSLICGPCLTVAYTEVVLLDAAGDGQHDCTMCLEAKDVPGWNSPAVDTAWICLNCVKRSAGKLHTDPDWDWRKPEQ